MIFRAGKCKKVRILLITPVFSSNVCHASVRSRKFIHMGRIKISTIMFLRSVRGLFDIEPVGEA